MDKKFKEAFRQGKGGYCQFCYYIEEGAKWVDACPHCQHKYRDIIDPRDFGRVQGQIKRVQKAKELKAQQLEEEEELMEATIEEIGLAMDFGVYGDLED